MSKQSEAVKSWRRRFRERIRIVLGGHCVCCGYNRSPRALEAHHIDPLGKEFTFGAVRAHPVALAKLQSELEKCVLVCSNCHIEIHDSMREPPTKSSFDKSAYDRMMQTMTAERNHGKFKKKAAIV